MTSHAGIRDAEWMTMASAQIMSRLNNWFGIMIIKYPLYKCEEVCQCIGRSLDINTNHHHGLTKVQATDILRILSDLCRTQ